MLQLKQKAALIRLKKLYAHKIAANDIVGMSEEDLLATLLILEFHASVLSSIHTLIETYPSVAEANEKIKVILHLLGSISGQTCSFYATHNVSSFEELRHVVREALESERNFHE